jgi:hypothetical protein
LKGGTTSENRNIVEQRLDCSLMKVVPKQPERKKNIFTKDKMLQQAMLPWHLKVLVAPGCRLKIEMEP